MRDILFRGFHRDENGTEKAFVNGELVKGTWVYGFYASKKETTYVFKEDYERNPVKTEHYIIVEQVTDWGLPNKFVAYPVIEETVGQYTEMKDKNGKNIFDWDIVKCYDKNVDESFCAIIMFGNPNGFYNYGWQLKPISETDFNVDILCWVDMEDAGAYIEIIGNIFENPELLEVK